MFFTIIISAFIALFPDLRDHSFTTAIYYKLFKEIDNEIVDDTQREQITTLFKALKEEAKTNSKVQSKIREDFWRVDQNYHATLEDYIAVIDQLDSLISITEEHLLDARDSLKDVVSEEQWEEGYLQIDRYIVKILKKVHKKMDATKTKKLKE